MKTLADHEAVSRLYAFADTLKAASAALDAVPALTGYGKGEIDTLLDQPLTPGELLDVSRKVSAAADAWQAEIDAAEAEAEEAADRHRMVSVGGHRSGGSAA